LYTIRTRFDNRIDRRSTASKSRIGREFAMSQESLPSFVTADFERRVVDSRRFEFLQSRKIVIIVKSIWR
jgi:hypothetical protein